MASAASLQRFNAPEHDPELGQIWQALYPLFTEDIAVVLPVSSLKMCFIEENATHSGVQVASSVIFVDDGDDDGSVQVNVMQNIV